MNIQHPTSNVQHRSGGRSAATPHPRRRSRRGFTLVEVTLATVVIGLGLLAVFGLGRLAIRNAKEAEDDTRAAMLADDVFATLRAASESYCASNDPVAWSTFWTGFQGGQPLPIKLSFATAFSNQFDDWVYSDGHGSNCVNYLYARPEFRNVSMNPVPEWGARYTLSVTLTNWFQSFGATNASASMTQPNEARVTLHIWPGPYGQDADALTFYTHFTEHGTLP